jgi:hypothetical protein
LSQDLLGPVQTDDSLGHQPGGNDLNLIAARTSSDGDLPGMQSHMSPLDTLGGQGTERAQVLSEAHGSHDIGQLSS